MGLISLLFLTQNGKNTPKLCTVTLAQNMQYMGEAFGANYGVIGTFGAYLEPILGPFVGPIVLFWLFFGQCHPFLLPKRALMPFYQMQWDRLKIYSNGGALNVHLGPFCLQK